MSIDDEIKDTVYSNLEDLEPRIQLNLKARLIRWVVRTAIGSLVFGTLALLFPWGRWILYVWVPLAVLSLMVLLFAVMTQARLKRRRKRMQMRQ